MKTHTDIVKLNITNPVVTIGIFDGVHHGHLLILNHLIEKARLLNGESVVITFWPHPRQILGNDTANLKFLNTLEEKQILLEKAGVDHLIIIPFTRVFAELSAKKFIKRYLIKRIRLKHLIIGYNHKFGKKRKGDFKLLKKFSVKHGFSIEKLDAKIIDQETVSSSIIRDALEQGKLSLANSYLGYEYLIRGIIIEGKAIGRTIGFPTANIEIEYRGKLIPKNGVYAVFVAFDGGVYKGMLNIGLRPTVDQNEKKLVIEVHIIDFKKSIYNQKITLIFVERIRDEQKFENIEALKDQLEKDKVTILKVLQQSNTEFIKTNKLYHERNDS